MKSLNCIVSLLAALTLATAGSSPAFAKKGTIEDQQDEVRKMRDEVLAELYKQDASIKQKINKADGYAVFSNVGVNLIFASVAGGKGIVVDRKG